MNVNDEYKELIGKLIYQDLIWVISNVVEKEQLRELLLKVPDEIKEEIVNNFKKDKK